MESPNLDPLFSEGDRFLRKRSLQMEIDRMPFPVSNEEVLQSFNASRVNFPAECRAAESERVRCDTGALPTDTRIRG